MKTGQFSTPIPAWVKIYGFGVLVLVVIFLIVFSFYFKIQRVAHIELVHSNDTLYVQCQVSEYEAIRSLDTAKLKLDSEQFIDVVFIFKKANLHKNNILVPVFVVDNKAFGSHINPAKEQAALIIVENSTLLSKVFSRSKSEKI